MDFKSNTPFGVPIVGAAELISGINIITLRCACKNILMGQMGIPIPCTNNNCKKIWFVSATSQIKIQEVLADVSKERLDKSIIDANGNRN